MAQLEIQATDVIKATDGCGCHLYRLPVVGRPSIGADVGDRRLHSPDRDASCPDAAPTPPARHRPRSLRVQVILQFCKENNLMQTFEALQSECGVSLNTGAWAVPMPRRFLRLVGMPTSARVLPLQWTRWSSSWPMCRRVDGRSSSHKSSL